MKTNFVDKKIALVFDWLDDKGGMEHVNGALADMFPGADIFTSVYDPQKFPEFAGRNVFASFLQKFPEKLRPKHQLLAPLMPMAFRAFDLSKYDIIISSASSGFSKCVQKTREDQIHICYCHTPVRYLYHAKKEYLNEYPLPWFLRPFRLFLPSVLSFLKKADQKAAQSVDLFCANSHFVADRIEQFYGARAEVVYPGRDLSTFFSQEKTQGAYYCALGRFIPYKKFDLLVQAFAENGEPLCLAGTGPELERCKHIAQEKKADNIQFLGFVPDEDLPALYAGAKAFLFPAEEDFGITPVEAMAAGTPVIYYNAGGACESVGESGIAFGSQSTESLNRAISEFEKSQKKFSPENIRKKSQEFSLESFQKNFQKVVEGFSKTT